MNKADTKCAARLGAAEWLVIAVHNVTWPSFYKPASLHAALYACDARCSPDTEVCK